MKRDLSFNIGLKKTNQVSFNIGSDKQISLCCTMINIPEEENLKVLNDSIFVSKQYKKINLNNKLINFSNSERNSYIYDEIFIKSDFKEFYNGNPLINVTIPTQKALEIYEQQEGVFTEYKDGIVLNKSLFVEVPNIREIELYKEEFVFKKLIATNDLSRDQQMLSREDITFQTIDTIERLEKSIRYHSLDIEDALSMSIDSKDIDNKFTDNFLDTKNRDLFYYDNYFLDTRNRPIYYLDSSFVSIDNRDLYCLEGNYNVEKYNEEISKISKDYFMFKDIKHLERQYEDYFISQAELHLERQYEDYFVDKNILEAFRQYQDVYVNTGDNLTNREYVTTTLNHSNKGINIDESMVNVILDGKDISINDKNYFVSNENKEMYIEDYKKNTVTTDPSGINTYDIFGVGLDNRSIRYTGDLLNLGIHDYNLRILDSSFVSKDDIEIKLEDTLVNAALKAKGIFKDDDIIEVDLERYLDINDDELTLSKRYSEIKHIDDDCFIYKKELESDISKNLDQPKVDYIVKEVHVNKFKERKSFRDNYEFVSVINCYEDWSEDVDDGQIDELLLPHKDYDYTSFLKELINDDGTIKQQYITNYDRDSMRYIVTLPIENPIEVYEYIGRDYIDLDVGFLKYFITVLESRWKSNIYSYAAMYAVDVLTDMMEFLYDFFETKYANDAEQIKMTERCMQLFRWYSEMAILNNCSYELEFATKKIYVDYVNKSLSDFNNMTILNNMQITSNYVLEPIDKTLPCSIIFVNMNKQNIPKLDLNFKLYNCNSNSSILITDNNNNETETIYEPGIYELNLELENKITIQYEPTDINQSIAISSASISNYPTRNFTVRYKGRIGDVNPILRDLFNRLILVTDAEQNTASDVAPATVAIYRMIEYFDLHHADKVKGKRLTIKK